MKKLTVSLFTLVFGATTPAISTVLTAFMGGLALGSWVLGRRADRLKFPILTYAAIEACVRKVDLEGGRIVVSVGFADPD